MIKKRQILFLAGFTVLISYSAFCETVKSPPSSGRYWTAPKKVNNYSVKDPLWNSIRDKAIDKAGPFALADLITIGLKNNPSTREAWEKARAAEYSKKASYGTLFPDISISAGASKLNYKALSSPLDADYSKNGAAIQLTYLLLDLGGRCSSISETREMLIAANYNYNSTLQAVVLSIEKAYYNLYSAQSALDAAQSDVDNSKASFDAATKRYQVGVAAKLEMLQARSVYEQSLYNLEGTRGALESAQAGLSTVLGFPADTKIDIVALSTDVPKAVSDDDITAVINDAMEHRPDIAAMRASVRSKKAAERGAFSALFPSLNAGASYQKNYYNFYSNPQPNDTDQTYSASLNLNWDIFNGLSNINNLKTRKALLLAEEEALKQAELNASAEIWVKYYNYKTALKKVEYAGSLLATVQMMYDMALESYKDGIKSILDLIDSESKLSNAKSSLIQSKEDLFVALAELAYATGTIYTDGENKYEESVQNK